ncbi:MAG: D-glycero-beta-D-manno-heptose 1-phosphate adenylyltransferase [Planctomycetota bacterium]
MTLGPEGIFYRTKGGTEGLLPTEARAVYDVTGAGDTVVALLGLGLGAGLGLEEAVRLANLAAGIVVGRFGTASVTREELRGAYGVTKPGKVLDEAGLPPALVALRHDKKRLVFTNGCFDLLHPGHLDYLERARSYGDVLIVGVNTDASIRRLKGEERPINPLEVRLAMLAGLEVVDFLLPFDEDTPARLIERVTPDVLVKGEDWRDKGVVGREWVEGHGGQVVLVPLLKGFSTTSLIERIRTST